jgi:hypothetical protein
MSDRQEIGGDPLAPRPSPLAPVLPLLAAFSRYDVALEWGVRRAAEILGTPALASPKFAFRETDYYTPTMGQELTKRFWVFRPLRDAGELADWKRGTIALEAEYASLGRHPEPRPLNLDPGYLTLAKLVLASTKDHAHRIYLSQGIFAEVTLYFKLGRWQPRDWTFPDYRRADYHEFFMAARQLLRTP